MNSIESNYLSNIQQPEIWDSPVDKYTAQEAEEMRLKQYETAKDIFTFFGAENFIRISANLHKKCFSEVNAEELSRHIMYRAFNGTIIDLNRENSITFVYDKHDRAMETLMHYILLADNFEQAMHVIDAINVDFENF